MTVRDLIEKAFRTIHILGDGESATASEAADGLDELNGVIEQANIDKLMASYQKSLVVPLVGGQSSYTIGPASSTPHVVATRPVEVLGGFARRSSTDFPISVGVKGDYDLIQRKDISVAGWQSMVYYEATYPKGTLYVYPVPQDALTSLHLMVMHTIDVFASLDDVVDMPPGYRTWLQYKTAKRLAPEYGMTFTQNMEDNMIDIESSLMRNNIKPLPALNTSMGLNNKGGAYNIRSDR